MSAPAIRARSVAEIIDATAQLLRRDPVAFLMQGAVIAIPAAALSLLLQDWLQPMAVPGAVPDPRVTGLAILGILAMVIWLYASIAAVVATASDAYLEGRADAGAGFARALRRALALAAGALLIQLLLFMGMIAGALAGALLSLVSPVLGAIVFSIGIFVWILVALARFSMVQPALVLEGRSVTAALGRSLQLTEGATWRIVGLLALLALIFLALGVGLYLLAYVLTRSDAVASGITLLAYVVLYPFAGAALALLYYDLRIRREGFDLELLARAVEGVPAAGGAPPV